MRRKYFATTLFRKMRKPNVKLHEGRYSFDVAIFLLYNVKLSRMSLVVNIVEVIERNSKERKVVSENIKIRNGITDHCEESYLMSTGSKTDAQEDLVGDCGE
uniref:Uncharacterized protein n=1 Tax=Rhizophagus irregularis (strain DAOM 181602 / DAOM 197198 / MUCL 43194) TaxID=747089 RepID=U9TCZ1_RHIID